MQYGSGNHLAFCTRSGDVQWSRGVSGSNRLAESTKGRVFFTAGRDLDRYVIWDYLKRRREIVA